MSIRIQTSQDVVPIAASREALTVVNSDAPEYQSLWKQFLGFYPTYGYRYQPSVVDYFEMLSREPVNLSFVVKNSEGLPIALSLLFTENSPVGRSASWSGGGFLPGPLFHPRLSTKQLRALELSVFDENKRRLQAHGANRWLCEADLMSGDTDRLEDHSMARFGALDVSIQCHVMDLTLPEDEFWNQIRHSAKSTINQGMKKYQFKVYDQDNYTDAIGERHRLLHHKCSGRVTRPISTFLKMYDWIREGCALMFEQLYEGETVQMICVVLGKETAYGASAADDPDFKPPIPLTHSMNFFIFEEVKRRGIKYYEVGETTFRDTIHRMRSPKEHKICEFKRSFGRQAMPQKRWIWFSGPDQEISYLEGQLALYKKHLAEWTP